MIHSVILWVTFSPHSLVLDQWAHEQSYHGGRDGLRMA